jgi:hypothetical protein
LRSATKTQDCFKQKSLRERFPDKALAHINEVLRASGIHGLDDLKCEELKGDSTGFKFKHSHDRYGFVLEVGDDFFRLSRGSSKMQDFLTWYFMFMPFASDLYESICSEIEKETEKKIHASKTLFGFHFYLTDFKHGNLNKRNIDALGRIVRDLPETSAKIDDGAGFDDITRVNIHISKQEAIAGKVRNCWYRLEAPLNDSGQYLNAQFEMRGSDVDVLGDDGIVFRTAGFDRSSLLDHRLALEVFLKEHALKRFLSSVVDGWSFSTVRGL